MIAQRAPALRGTGMGGNRAQGGVWHRPRPAGASPGPLTHVAAVRREQAGAGAVVCKEGPVSLRSHPQPPPGLAQAQRVAVPRSGTPLSVGPA